MFVSPSPSKSALGFVERTVSVLVVDGTWDELPLEVVATTVNEPLALAAKVSVMVAEVPLPLMLTFEAAMAAGLNVGRNENVAPVRLEPLTWKPLIVGVLSANVWLRDVIAGIVSTVKFVLEVAVEVPTVTLIGPVVAPAGTVAVRLFAVAAVTAAVVPLN